LPRGAITFALDTVLLFAGLAFPAVFFFAGLVFLAGPAFALVFFAFAFFAFFAFLAMTSPILGKAELYQ